MVAPTVLENILKQTTSVSATEGVRGAGFIPPGVVLPYAGSTAPTGWALAYGQAVSRTTYADLYAIIGTTYGVGDGSTTFNLPDLRGRVPAGKDNMGGVAASRLTNSGTGNPGIDGSALGAVGGVDRHTITTAQMPAHTHTYDKYAGSSAGSSPSSGSGQQAGFSNIASGSVGTGDAHPNAQPTIVLNHIIKT